MTIRNRKTGSAALARKPVDVRQLHRDTDTELPGRSAEPATATLSFNFDSADRDILRALQEASERNGFEMQTAPVRLPSSKGTYRHMTLPSDFKGKLN